MAEIYSEIALDHFRNPRNAGTMHDADGAASVENPASGAVVSLQLRIVDERVVHAMFYGSGLHSHHRRGFGIDGNGVWPPRCGCGRGHTGGG